jgi:trimeric autotransporter adhesin
MKKLASGIISCFLAIHTLHAQVWLPVDSGFTSRVTSLKVYNNELYAGGSFWATGGPWVVYPAYIPYVARTNGGEWYSASTTFSSSATIYLNVTALEVYNNELYAAGDFEYPGRYLARWNGSTWTNAGSGFENSSTFKPFIHAMAVYGGELYAAGQFTSAGGVSANNIAKWNGTAWSPVGGGLNSPVYALGIYNGSLYAGGGALSSGLANFNSVARWNGNSWTSVNAAMDNFVSCLISHNGFLYAAGHFTTAGGISAMHVAKWDGNSWSAVGDGLGGVNAGVPACFHVFNGKLTAAGSFTSSGATPISPVAQWDGSSWTGLGSASTTKFLGVMALGSFNSALYAAGNFSTVTGSDTILNIAMWSDPLGITANEKQSGFRAWPNPVNGLVNIQPSEDMGECIVTLRNLLGIELMREATGNGKLQLDVRHLPGGCYQLSLFSGGQLVGTKKIIILSSP